MALKQPEASDGRCILHDYGWCLLADFPALPHLHQIGINRPSHAPESPLDARTLCLGL